MAAAAASDSTAATAALSIGGPGPATHSLAEATARRAAANAAARAHGYPSLLPLDSLHVPSTDPFWYDRVGPTHLWGAFLSRITRCEPLQPLKLRAGEEARLPPKPAGHLRVVAISDTHNLHDKLPLPPPPSAGIDLLLHAGDFSGVGTREEVDNFTRWIRQLDVKYKIVIAGNHDVSFDEAEYEPNLAMRFRHRELLNPRQLKAALVEGYAHEQPTAANPFPAFARDGGVAYLEDSGVSIEGVRFWGSPWQPAFYDWAFNLPIGEKLREKWDFIPNETNVLITHGPPLGYGDLTQDKRRVGCTDLLAQIQTRIRPLYHISGHIHEGYGSTSDGVTTYINASSCNVRYDARCLNAPIVFDVPIPQQQQAE